MHIAAICCTYKRPERLGRLVWCFLQQTYQDSELIVLDDAGQFEYQEGERWQLISIPRRFRTLGEKRNAAAALASPSAEAYAIWDDDDVYLPWALEASVAALKVAPWSRPSVVSYEDGAAALHDYPTEGLFHAAWAYSRTAFRSAGGYPAVNSGEDQALGRRFEEAGIAEADPVALGFRPFFVWDWSPDISHISGLGEDGYELLGDQPAEPVERLSIEPPPISTRIADLFEADGSRAS